MLARIPVILFGIPAVYGLLVAAGDIPRLVFFIIISLLAQNEVISMFNSEFKYKPVLEWLCGTSILVSTNLFGEKGLLFSFALSTLVLMACVVLRGLKGDGYRRFCLGLFSILYLPFCLSFFLLLALAKGPEILFYILASIWALDIGAYIFGMSIRGPKLAVNISPNKTISGAIGGAVTSIAFILLINKYNLIQLDQTKTICLAFLVASIGQIADLFESVLKREANIKDSGSLLGAHGGILDRIDSVLFLGPICYALFVI